MPNAEEGKMTDYSRRDFVTLVTRTLLAAGGLLGLGGVLRYLSFSTEPETKAEFDLGVASEYPVGSRTQLPEVPAVVIRTEAGFSAFSLACPHLGCTVEDSNGEFVCPCHGSRFDLDGMVRRGPARENLRTLRIETTADDQLFLFLT